MKKLAQAIILTLLLFPIRPQANGFAQDYVQWKLPEGAKARIGKGPIPSNLPYSPDGTRFAVASSIGARLYDANIYREIDLIAGHTAKISTVVFSPDCETLASGGGCPDTTTPQRNFQNRCQPLYSDVQPGQPNAGHYWPRRYNLLVGRRKPNTSRVDYGIQSGWCPDRQRSRIELSSPPRMCSIMSQ